MFKFRSHIMCMGMNIPNMNLFNILTKRRVYDYLTPLHDAALRTKRQEWCQLIIWKLI